MPNNVVYEDTLNGLFVYTPFYNDHPESDTYIIQSFLNGYRDSVKLTISCPNWYPYYEKIYQRKGRLYIVPKCRKDKTRWVDIQKFREIKAQFLNG